MKIVYPKTRIYDIEKAQKQILKGRELIYKETIFKDIPLLKNPSGNWARIHRRDRELEENEEIIVSLGMHLFIISIIVFVIAVGLLQFLVSGISLLLALFFAILCVLTKKHYARAIDENHYLRRIEKKELSGIKDRADDFMFVVKDKNYTYKNSGENAIYLDKEYYDIVECRIQDSRKIIKSCDQLYWITKSLQTVQEKLNLADDVKKFCQKCRNKINVDVFGDKNGYYVHMTEEDRVSDSADGKITVAGNRFDFSISAEDFEKIFAKDGVIDFSGIDAEANDCAKELYKLAKEVKPVLEDRMPLLPEKLVSETAKCEIIEI